MGQILTHLLALKGQAAHIRISVDGNESVLLKPPHEETENRKEFYPNN